jgi:MraZ protein
MFVGSTINAVDAKGRTSVPAPFRAALAGASTIYLWPSFPGQSLEGGGLDLLQDYHRRLEDGAGLDGLREDFEYAIFADARALECDSTGRILIPEDLRAHAGLVDRAAFVGLGRRFEIWSPALLEARRAEARQRAGARRGLLYGQAGGGSA